MKAPSSAGGPSIRCPKSKAVPRQSRGLPMGLVDRGRSLYLPPLLRGLADELGRPLFTPRSVLMFAWIHRTLSAAWLIGLAACAVTALGCGSTRTSNTARTATEQLLISDAIDRTVQQINFKVLEGQTVFFDERHLLE